MSERDPFDFTDQVVVVTGSSSGCTRGEATVGTSSGSRSGASCSSAAPPGASRPVDASDSGMRAEVTVGTSSGSSASSAASSPGPMPGNGS